MSSGSGVEPLVPQPVRDVNKLYARRPGARPLEESRDPPDFLDEPPGSTLPLVLRE